MAAKEQSNLSDREIKVPQQLEAAIDRVVPDEVTAIGFVACNLAGEFLLVEPTNHFDNVSYTFPKVQRQIGEQPSQALLRCLREKIGAQPTTIYPLHQLWGTKQSQSMFFAGLVTVESQPTSPYVARAEWHSIENARKRLKTSKNPKARRRDLEVLESVSQLCLTPERRLLLAVQEFHRMGFERLRIAPYLAPSGMFWRCGVVPKSCISNTHGAIAVSKKQHQLLAVAGSQCQDLQHSSGSQQCIFGWEDSCFDFPKELAYKCLDRSHELIFAGWGEDRDYVRWYEEMLRLTAPWGLIYALADWELPSNHLPVVNTIQKVAVPLPPQPSVYKGEP